MQIALPWSAFKQKNLPIRYIETQGNYYLVSESEDDEFTCRIVIGSADGDDFNGNFKSGAVNLG